MTEVEAWQAQVDSDFAAADRVLIREEPGTYCQAVAKYQQVVEKSINVMDAALRERGVLTQRVRAEHYPVRMINRLVRLPREADKDLSARLVKVFRRWSADIYDLCGFAPKLPQPNERYQKNTEYPYQNEDGSWTAPATRASFSLTQVQRFAITARSLRREAQEISTAARLNRL